MGAMLPRAVLLLLLAVLATAELGRGRLKARREAAPRRPLNGTDIRPGSPLGSGGRGGSIQPIRRVRRSWLADYLDDMWWHLRENLPEAVLYVLPVTLLVLLLLCCITVALD